MVKTYVLSRSVDYEGTNVLGVFDDFNKADLVRNNIIGKEYKNRKADDTYSGDDFSTLRYDDICFIIETFDLNTKKRDF